MKIKNPKTDFLGIKKKYPKSYECLCRKDDGSRSASWHILCAVDLNKDNIYSIPHNAARTLYDFFNSHDIHISIQPELYCEGVNWNWQVIWYVLPIQKYKAEIANIFYNGTYLYGDNHEYPTQEHAEIAAWDMAFRILEAKLNGEKTEPGEVYKSVDCEHPLTFDKPIKKK